VTLDPALIWFLVGVGLALLELVAPGVILVFFAAGAWVAALTTWLGLTPSLQSQLPVFAISSVVLLVALRRWISGKFSGHVTGVQDPSTNLDEFTGKRVEVLEDVLPGETDGKVEFKGAGWSARSDQSIRKGEAAFIERVDGLTLIITKNPEENP
jgi:membrane protein implicated in regulation of membrane protease activity